MKRPVLTVALYRPNIHIQAPSFARDVWDIVQLGLLCFMLYWIVVLVLT